MTDQERLDEAVQRLKSQMASTQKVDDDWKKAYLHRLNIRAQSLNRMEVQLCRN